MAELLQKHARVSLSCSSVFLESIDRCSGVFVLNSEITGDYLGRRLEVLSDLQRLRLRSWDLRTKVRWCFRERVGERYNHNICPKNLSGLWIISKLSPEYILKCFQALSRVAGGDTTDQVALETPSKAPAGGEGLLVSTRQTAVNVCVCVCVVMVMRRRPPTLTSPQKTIWAAFSNSISIKNSSVLHQFSFFGSDVSKVLKSRKKIRFKWCLSEKKKKKKKKKKKNVYCCGFLYMAGLRGYHGDRKAKKDTTRQN